MKIYAVHGMMEYQTLVRIGKNNVKICFSGGSFNNGCRQPARYSTSNLIVQEAIERSAEFRKGIITFERSITLNEELLIESNTPKAESMRENNMLPTPEATEKLKMDRPKDTPTPDPEVRMEVEDLESTDTMGEEMMDKLEVINASCKDVAKQYLQEHYGENPTPLRTREDVQRCAAKHGITFNFE